MHVKATRFQRILVPVHALHPEGYAVRLAIDLARRHHGEIFLVLKNIERSVSADHKYFWLLAEDEDASRTADVKSFELHSGDLNELEIPVHHAHVDNQPIEPGIVEYAANNEIDLIVMETYGHRSLGRFVFGGTAGEVVRWSRCPVLTVRKQFKTSSDVSVQRILVPVDFSGYSRDAIRLANSLVKLYEASIQLLYVHEERPLPVFDDSGPSGTTVLKTQEDKDNLARKALQTLYSTSDQTAVPASYHVRRGHVSKEILDFATSQAPDLIIISSHGLTDNSDFTLGNVAEKVVRHARCPVLTLKASHEPASEPGDQVDSAV